MTKNYNNNYYSLCGLVNTIGATAFVINPIYSILFSALSIYVVYKLPDIFLEPISFEDFILYSIFTLAICYILIVLSYRFGKLEALMLCLPLIVGKETWFYFKRYG